MRCQSCQVKLLLLCLALMELVVCEPPKHTRQVAYKSWPMTRSQSLRNGGMFVALRGPGTQNIVSRLPTPHMMIKSPNPIQFGFPQRAHNIMVNRPHANIKAQPSTHIYFKTGAPQKSAAKKPYAAALTSSPVIKFSSPAQKTAIKFKSPPPVPLKSKPEYIYEKVTVPKFSEPAIITSDAAIHQIAAPNLSLNQLDTDLTKVSVQAFALEKPVHSAYETFQNHPSPQQYQVHESINDLTFKNAYTGQTTLYAPDNDPTLSTPALKPIINDPVNTPSNGKPKPADVLYHSNIDFNASPLVQQHFTVDPFTYPVPQPQLQQYHLQQNAMLQQGMPLAAYNPTYLVMQSNNLLGQHQQHLTPQLFSPAHGYIDTHSYSQGAIVSPNYEVASLGQINSAQKDVYHQLQDSITSTVSPTTAGGYYDVSASHNIPSVVNIPEPKPNNYQYSQNFIDLPDDHLSSNDIHNLLNYDEFYQRQLENDLVLREAHEKLQNKLEYQKQQENVAFDLHQQAIAQKFNPLRIVVPDDEFKKRNDEEVYDDFEYEDDISEDLTTEQPKTQAEKTK